MISITPSRLPRINYGYTTDQSTIMTVIVERAWLKELLTQRSYEQCTLNALEQSRPLRYGARRKA